MICEVQHVYKPPWMTHFLPSLPFKAMSILGMEECAGLVTCTLE